jgi:thiol-disulfide isomerase/thioredoxin
MKDFMVQDLEKKHMRLSEILTNKKYILLDFWGTWCTPCKELTPELKNINNKLGDSIQIISIAYDKNLDQVKKYIQDNDMNWDHLYSEDRKGIIDDLRVTSYPTFILINQKRKILYRGKGKFSLDQIKNRINRDNESISVPF